MDVGKRDKSWGPSIARMLWVWAGPSFVSLQQRRACLADREVASRDCHPFSRSRILSQHIFNHALGALASIETLTQIPTKGRRLTVTLREYPARRAHMSRR